MDQPKPTGIWPSVLLWGFVWAPLTTLFAILFDWHTTGHLESVTRIVGRLASFMAVAILLALFLPRRWRLNGAAIQERIGPMGLVALFAAPMLLMLGFLVWAWIAKV